MTFTLILSQRIDCDIRSIVHLVNDQQLFFFVENGEQRVTLPSKPLDNPFLTQTEIERALLRKGCLQPRFPEQHYVLLTGRPLAEERISLKHKLGIFSDNGKYWESSNQRSLWFAKQIIRYGLSKLISHECQNKGCICSRYETFYFLCVNCEKLLRDLDYRDAVLHLKGTIQWLNERLPSPAPDLSRSPAPQVPARLRLAEYYAKSPRTSQAFRGKGILMVLHFLSDLVPFVTALKKMGADYQDMILIAKPYPYPKRDYVSHHLRRLGVHVYRATKQYSVIRRAHDILRELSSVTDFKNKRFAVIEDGGYFTPLLHRPEFRRLLNNCDGTVEQTTKGIRTDQDIPTALGIPILSVAKCDFKSRYEAPEIGRVTIQNITRFVPNTKLSGGHAIVFGFGDIGTQVGYQLNKTLNMAVSVVDTVAAKVMEARHRRDFVSEAEMQFDKLLFKKRADLVIGTTGKKTGSITRQILRRLPDGCIIVSTSSDQVEIDVKALDDMAVEKRDIEEGKTIYRIRSGSRFKTLTLLAEGYPINFYGSESLPNASIDPIMTLLLLCAVELAKGTVKKRVIDEGIVNTFVKDFKLIEVYLSRHRHQDI
jgi:adenosylhomocysteinase